MSVDHLRSLDEARLWAAMETLGTVRFRPHIRTAAKRRAVEALVKKPSIPAESTEILIEAAKESAQVEIIAEEVPLQVLEGIGSSDRIRTSDFLVNIAIQIGNDHFAVNRVLGTVFFGGRGEKERRVAPAWSG